MTRNRLVKRTTKTPEKVIQDSIRQVLTLQGHKVYRANVATLFTKDGRRIRTGLPNGFPDLFGFRKSDHQFFAIEVKTPKGRISTNQYQQHYDLMHYGVIHGIARSVDDATKIVKDGLVGYGYGDEDKTTWLRQA